uniref:Cytochrome c oxidase subunit n=1 Tax=Solanum lycopersicum TaxID=4081 RepID=A0A3Q7H6R5_SOLLC
MAEDKFFVKELLVEFGLDLLVFVIQKALVLENRELYRSCCSPQIELKTAPADFRFPTTNQTRHCFTRYVEFHRCVAAKGDEAADCARFAKYYRALCPGEWVDKWNEQRENGTFPGPL